MSDDTKLIQYIEVILVHLGYDTDTPLFKDTALRFASRMRPYFANVEVPEGSIANVGAETTEELKGMDITIAPVRFTAMCAQHFMPIFGSVGIQLIVNELNPRMKSITDTVTYYTEQFIDQRLATRKIFREVAVGLNPLALYVAVSARHTCEGNEIITTDYGLHMTAPAAQSLIERVEKSVV